MKKENILFTGPPGCGKSTIIEKMVGQSNKPMTGFFTREIKEKGHRVGFSITTMDGKQGVLAHQDIKSSYRVGKYGVNQEDIDQIVVPSIMPASENMTVVIDEIGKMECLSHHFRAAVIRVLDSEHPVIGSIPLRGGSFMEQIKKRKDVMLIPVSEKNRNRLVDMVLELDLGFGLRSCK